VVRAIMSADVMMGHDPDCARWIRKFREVPAMGADGEMARGRRDTSNRRRRES
jgi:5-methyltetrahydrofolate--homocysteine methyltransferase